MNIRTAFALLLLTLAAPAWGAPGVLSADVPATNLQRVVLQAGAGEAVVTVSGDDAIHVQLDLHQDERSFLGLFHWLSASTTRDLAGATLQKSLKDGVLTLSLAYPSGESRSDVKQRWTLMLPARLALEAGMDAGRLEIDGVQGGVQARLGAGDVTIRSPGGPIKAQVSAGRLHVISDSAQPGALSLHSSFGLAVLSLNGKYYGPPEQHGFMSSFHFFGNSVTQQAGGKDDMDLKVTAGLADLRVGPLGNFKDYHDVFKDDAK
ncbi:MAG TPA: hypothetical protein VHP13_06160 [Gammaproteobacteria bacterium]|jgi:hypothetical protein|nr:hypothetical protein [Gammaproteobacteria bacterium]